MRTPVFDRWVETRSSWLLGGSWGVISRVESILSMVTIVLPHISGLITPFITPHEPPSTGRARRAWRSSFPVARCVCALNPKPDYRRRALNKKQGPGLLVFGVPNSKLQNSYHPKAATLTPCNPKPLNPKPLNPQTPKRLNPRTLNPKLLNP